MSTTVLTGEVSQDPAAGGVGGRLAAIDVVRGLAMVVMALDHTRDFLSNAQVEPEDIQHTWTALFLTRWVTHFCAPAFFLLAGVGASMYGRRRSSGQLRSFLLSRGAWLVVLEFTVIGFAWTFHPGWGMFGVIACLGVSMMLLAGLVSVPRRVVGGIAAVLIGGHDLFDFLRPKMFDAGRWLFVLLHARGAVHVGSQFIFVLFPLIPWCAVMFLGFGIGPMFERFGARERKMLAWAGMAAVALFFLLRLTNVYGNPGAELAASTPGEWHRMASAGKTILLVLDVEKYPPSLDYLLMTLGPICLLLAAGPRLIESGLARAFEVYGRVPLFYYIVHLYAIHLAAIAVGAWSHQPVAWLFHGGFFMNDAPAGWGHGLPVVYAVWAGVVLALYWPCVWSGGLKRRHPRSLLRFL